MVDIKVEHSPSKKKFSPKFEEGSPPKAKKNKKNFDDDNTSPKKKIKYENPGKPVKSENAGKPDKKKSKKPKEVGKENSEKGLHKKTKGKPGFDGKKKKFGKRVTNANEVQPVVLLNKKETREKMKQVKEARKKFKQEDVFDIGVKAKKVWEEVRREDCPEQKKMKLVQELHSLVQGNIKKIIFAHDTVRVVECLMAVGSEDIRDKMFTELQEDIIEMSKSKYAHFFVQKMLKYGNKEQKGVIFKKMEGQIARLMKNKTAGYVVETFYNDIASGPQRVCMLQEFLDNEFMHFKDPEVKTVPDILAKYPLRRSDCVKNLQRNVEVLIRKGAYNHSLSHTVIYNHMLVAEPKARAETIEQLREALVHMVHTREGAYAALNCLWHGTAKDRKAIIKSFKTFMLKTAQEEWGHTVLLAIFDCVDDTKIVGKAVVGELMEEPEELFTNKFGVRVLKYLFCGRDTKYLQPDLINILAKGDGNEHSRKPAEQRRKELLEVAAPPVLKYILQKLPDNLYDAPTTITLTAIINSCPPSEPLSQLMNGLAKQAAKPFAKDDASPNIVENGASNMMLKKIIAKDKERKAAGEETFSSHILKHLEEEGTESWLRVNRGCFLLVNLWDTEIEEVRSSLKEKIHPYTTILKRQDTPGAKLLIQKLN